MAKIIIPSKIFGIDSKEALERIMNEKEDANPPPQPPAGTTLNPIRVQLKDNFYIFPMDEVRKSLSDNYLKFLKDSGYAPNLERATELRISKGILKSTPQIAQIITNSQITQTTEANTNYIVSINHPDARKLAEALGYKTPTTAMIYRLFIPYIKQSAQQGNSEAQATLKEMGDKAEWLEDLILNKNRLKIGTREQPLALPTEDKYFDRQDINEYGYPTAVKLQGEFYHWHVAGDERAAFRGRVLELDLYLSRGPALLDDWLGVRLAKFF